MRFLSLLLLLLGTEIGFAYSNEPYSICVDASVNNITTSFTQFSTQIPDGMHAIGASLNTVAGAVDIAFAPFGSSAPSSSTNKKIAWPGTAIGIFDDTLANTGLFLRSRTGSTITTGIICVTLK